MNVPLDERGKYYRGLLVLIRRDRIINEKERELMLQVGRQLDFDCRFCENAIDDILRNPNITDRPIKFLEKTTAEDFVRDAVALALSDGELHPHELAWLKAIAEENGIDPEWVLAQIKRTAAQ